jgi:hypothetical protein
MRLPYVDDFAFADTPINENLVRDLAGGAFIAQPTRDPCR